MIIRWVTSKDFQVKTKYSPARALAKLLEASVLSRVEDRVEYLEREVVAEATEDGLGVCGGNQNDQR